MVLNSVSLAVVANYVTQCEMMLFYIRGLALRLQEKSSDLRNAMKVLIKRPMGHIYPPPHLILRRYPSTCFCRVVR